jgi:hypothetical protein
MISKGCAKKLLWPNCGISQHLLEGSEKNHKETSVGIVGAPLEISIKYFLSTSAWHYLQTSLFSGWLEFWLKYDPVIYLLFP